MTINRHPIRHFRYPTSPERLHDTTVRRYWEQARKVNIDGATVTLDPDGPLAEAAWASVGRRAAYGRLGTRAGDQNRSRQRRSPLEETCGTDETNGTAVAMKGEDRAVPAGSGSGWGPRYWQPSTCQIGPIWGR
jgi:hypothetical protein